MPRGVLRKHNFTKSTLLKIATIGALTLVATTSPYFLHRVAKSYFEDKTRKMVRARAKKLRELERRKLISFRELGNGEVRIELNHFGKSLVRQYHLDEIKLERAKKWDNVWRVIIYDIPVAQRKASNAFRKKLEDLGLFPLQKSVWVSPYECLPEIDFLASVFEINFDRCICYIKTNHIPRESEAKKFFRL